MSDPTRLLLVRHAEPSAETRNRVYGRLDVTLSPEGEEHAERLAGLLATTPITAVYAARFAAHSRQPPRSRPRTG